MIGSSGIIYIVQIHQDKRNLQIGSNNKQLKDFSRLGLIYVLDINIPAISLSIKIMKHIFSSLLISEFNQLISKQTVSYRCYLLFKMFLQIIVGRAVSRQYEGRTKDGMESMQNVRGLTYFRALVRLGKPITNPLVRSQLVHDVSLILENFPDYVSKLLVYSN